MENVCIIESSFSLQDIVVFVEVSSKGVLQKEVLGEGLERLPVQDTNPYQNLNHI